MPVSKRVKNVLHRVGLLNVAHSLRTSIFRALGGMSEGEISRQRLLLHDLSHSTAGNNAGFYDWPALLAESEIRAQNGFRAGAAFLISEIGLDLVYGAPDDNYRPLYEYMRAMLYARNNNPEKATRCIECSAVPMGIGGDLFYSDAMSDGMQIAAWQKRAIRRKIPPILISSMPRAASASLVSTLSTYLNIPAVRISLGNFPNFSLMEPWAKQFMQGGAVLHDHFGASDFNVDILERMGNRNVTVLVRDPRAAAFSLINKEFLRKDVPISEDKIMQSFRVYLEWFEQWITVANAGKLKVRWVDTARLTGGKESVGDVMNGIVSWHGLTKSDLFSNRVELKTRNFVQGRPDAWRDHVSEDIQQVMNAAMSSKMREILDV